LSLEATLRTLPCVADVQTRVEAMVRVTLPEVSDPVVGQLIGIDSRYDLIARVRTGQ